MPGTGALRLRPLRWPGISVSTRARTRYDQERIRALSNQVDPDVRRPMTTISDGDFGQGRGTRILRRRVRTALVTIGRLAVVVLVGFIALLYLIQDQMIFPGASTQGRPESTVRAPGPPGPQLIRPETRGGVSIAALFGPALLPDGRNHPDAPSRPALLYFYGNAMCLAYCEPEFLRFRRLGLNVLIPDYMGYGMSGGKASEVGCRETGEACYAWLLQQGIPADRILVGGWSLGGAVAIDLASRKSVGGLIAFSTFTSTHDMALSIVPIPLPRFMFSHKFDSLTKIASMTCPILLGHGRLDRLVPFPMHARLAAAVRAPLTTFVVEDAEHNDFYDVGGRQIDEALRRFLADLERTPAK